jgi:hypothetical protein
LLLAVVAVVVKELLLFLVAEVVLEVYLLEHLLLLKELNTHLQLVLAVEFP